MLFDAVASWQQALKTHRKRYLFGYFSAQRIEDALGGVRGERR